MKEVWRWFGPQDMVSIEEIVQTGASGVVSALHHLANGAVWAPEEIKKRKAEITTHDDGRPTGLTWDVVESLPVSEEIKTQTGAWRAHIENYKTSLENLAAEGIKVVCYNFMPVLDWSRTDLDWVLNDGATCMRFDLVDFAVFDLFILKRPGAEVDVPRDIQKKARDRFETMADEQRQALVQNVVQGLPGANQSLTHDDLRVYLARYRGIDATLLKENQYAFLREVVPVAERLGMRLCCHPDDPPFPLLGLPRVMSTEQDYMELVQAIDSPANGITLCSGSLGVRAKNDLPGMMQRLGKHVHFLHLRNVHRDSEIVPTSFHEAAHLAGSTDMVALIAAVLAEETRRFTTGETVCEIPMRPDHGHKIADDFKRPVQPGYPYIGRLRGLAEIRGVSAALVSSFAQHSLTKDDAESDP
ncbi:MAG: mannonate dehydratase [Paracoccaceae bacterium]|nr:mannonate dehydratase [Paracoccaceae bacterium]